jgi:hypothetical protein
MRPGYLSLRQDRKIECLETDLAAFARPKHKAVRPELNRHLISVARAMPDEQFFHELSNVRETAIRILTEGLSVVIIGPLLLHFHQISDRACAALSSFPPFCCRRFMAPGDCSSQSHNPDVFERLAFCAFPLNGFLCAALVGCKFHWRSFPGR